MELNGTGFFMEVPVSLALLMHQVLVARHSAYAMTASICLGVFVNRAPQTPTALVE